METVSNLYRVNVSCDKRGDFLFSEFMMACKEGGVDSENLFNTTFGQWTTGDYSELRKHPAFDITRIPSRAKNTKPVPDIDVGTGGLAGVGLWLFSEKAISCMKDLIAPHIYAHPLTVVESDYRKPRVETGEKMHGVFANTFAQDLLDMDKSVCDRFQSSGGLCSLIKIAIKDGVAVPPIFKFAEFPRGTVFVSQAFVDRYHECGLTGIEFELVTPELKSAWL